MRWQLLSNDYFDFPPASLILHMTNEVPNHSQAGHFREGEERERVWENIPHETKRKDKKRKKKIEKRLGLKKNEKKIYMKKK